MTTRPPQLSSWIGTSLVGWIATVPLVGVFAWFGELLGVGGARVFVALGAGAGMGVAQALSNQRTVFGRWSWVIASAIGVAVPALVADLMRIPREHLLALHGSIALGGLTAGIWQHVLLRRVFDGTALWIPASLVGWTLLGTGSGLADYMVRGRMLAGVGGAGAYLGLTLAGALGLGVATGLALQRLRPRA